MKIKNNPKEGEMLIEEKKKPVHSKTLWLSLVVAIVPFFPSVQEIVAANPEIVGMALGGLFFFLRIITKGKISIE